MTLLAGLVTVFAINGFFWVGMSDFAMFMYSGAAWLAGSNPYESSYPNLQPPILLLLFAPLSMLPTVAAKALWTVAGLFALVASWTLIIRELALSRADSERAIALVSLSYPVLPVWFQGQPIWLLMYPCTRAWAAYRGNREQAAGLWLVPLILAKPQLALAVLLLPWRVWLSCGLTSAALALLSVPIIGIGAWKAWLVLGSQVHWLSFPGNASVWGLATRLQSRSIASGALPDIHPAVAFALVLFLVAAARIVWRSSTPDLRLARAVVWGLLAAPLGWISYLLVATGPLLACWPAGRLSAAALALWLIPLPLIYPLLQSSWGVVLLGSVYSLSLGLWAVATSGTPASYGSTSA